MRTIYFSSVSVFALLLLSSFSTISAVTFTVTNVNDSGVGSLRQAILDLNSAGTESGSEANEIIVMLSGTSGSTIFLQSELPAITNQVYLNGQDQNSSELLTIDGSIAGSISAALEINSASASDCLIKNINIQNISGDNSVVYGILITNQAVNCSIEGCFISNIERTSFIPFQVAGIKMDSSAFYTGSIKSNIIKNTPLSNSFGILIDGDIGLASEIEASCSNNCIQRIGGSRYIEVTNVIYGDCNNNYLDGFSVLSTNSRGIRVSTVQGDVCGNQIKNITTNQAFVGISSSLIEGNCSNNCIEGILTTGNLIKGIGIGFLNGDFSANSISNLTTAASLGLSGVIVGSEVLLIEGEIAHNSFEDFTTGSAERAGSIFGFINRSLEVQFKCNRLQNFSRGVGELSGGEVIGFLHNGDEPIKVNIINNSITNLSAGGVAVSGEVVGIRIRDALTMGIVSGNTISNLQASAVGIGQGQANGILINQGSGLNLVCNVISDISGAGEDSGVNSGIFIMSGENFLFNSNIITNIASQGSTNTAHGIIVGAFPKDEIRRSLFENNVISNISSELSGAYGVTISGEFSISNQILTNSISDIDTASIFYKDEALLDAAINLSLISCTGQSVTVSGTITPNSNFFNTEFLLQFFASDLSSPSQAKFFFGEQIITVGDGPTPFTVTFKTERKIFASQFVTATATALVQGAEGNFNTSVVSNVLVGCSTAATPGFCGMLATCPNDGLPFVDCPVIDCGTFECFQC